MKNLFAISLALLFAACGDGKAPLFDNLDASQIEGLWRRDFGSETTYHFASGLATVTNFYPGGSIQAQYAYRTNLDTVHLSEYPSGKRWFWVVDFENENTVDVRGADSSSLVLRLKRF